METERADHRLTPDELIDEASMASFPASDPPSYWARETAKEIPAEPRPADEEEPGA